MSSVEFDVSYRLPEYREFVFEHLRHQGKQPGHLGRRFISILASVAFLAKRAKMPLCSFVIDQTGIRRRTAAGELSIPWSRVTEVHHFSPGYLIEKERGAVPIPYRCLSENQRSAIEALVTEWKTARAKRGNGDV